MILKFLLFLLFFNLPDFGVSGDTCVDGDENCDVWAALGECHQNSRWMHQHCQRSCRICSPAVNRSSPHHEQSTDSKAHHHHLRHHKIVFGGQVADDIDAASFVQIRFVDRRLRTYAACGGTLLANGLILSAGHCFGNYSEEREAGCKVIVYAGSKQLFGGKMFDVDRIVIHPKYDFAEDLKVQAELISAYERYGDNQNTVVQLLSEKSSAFALNDLAIVSLKTMEGMRETNWDEPQPFSVAELMKEWSVEYIDDLTDCTFLGIGLHQPSGPRILPLEQIYNPQNVMKVSVPSLFYCSSFSKEMTNLICTAGFVCGHDSGGPLSCTVDGVRKVVGIASRSSNDACVDQPMNTMARFTKVTTNMKWIVSTVSKFEDNKRSSA